MNPRRFAAVISLVAAAAVPLAAARRAQNPFAARAEKEHALLGKLAGRWTTKFALTMPGAPPLPATKGTEVGEMLGELWVVSRYVDPESMGGTFSGSQLVGYDPEKEKYVSVWADSQTASLTLQEGTYDEATRTLTLSGKSTDPMTGQEGTARAVHQWTDDDHRTQTLFVPGPGGAEMKLFEIVYERAK